MSEMGEKRSLEGAKSLLVGGCIGGGRWTFNDILKECVLRNNQGNRKKKG